MAARTYLPHLIFIARTLCGYMKRWERQIKDNLTDEQEVLFDAVLAACEALEAAIVITGGS